VIQHEISRVLVLSLFGEKGGAHRTAQEIFVLDNAFVLIEGHPMRWRRRPDQKPGPPAEKWGTSFHLLILKSFSK
jgi:hypothetical protein